MSRFRSSSPFSVLIGLTILVLVHTRSFPLSLIEVNSKDSDTFPADYRSWTSVLFRDSPNAFKNLQNKANTQQQLPPALQWQDGTASSIKTSLKRHNQVNGERLKTIALIIGMSRPRKSPESLKVVYKSIHLFLDVKKTSLR